MTLIPALRAQIFLLRHDRTTLFWGFGFVPIIFLFFIGAVSFLPPGRLGPSADSVDPILHAARSASFGGNPVVHLFVALGAAAIFGGEYRHATWRLIGPRAPRPVLFAAKWCSFVLAACASLAVVIAGSGLLAWLSSAVHPSIHLSVSTATVSVAAAFGASLLELAALGSVVALLTVATRSGFGAVLSAFLFSSAQAFAESYSPPPPTSGPWLALPSYAGDIARQWALPPQGLPAPTGAAAGLAALSLAAWCAVAAGVAMLLLQRQDWSRE